MQMKSLDCMRGIRILTIRLSSVGRAQCQFDLLSGNISLEESAPSVF